MPAIRGCDLAHAPVRRLRVRLVEYSPGYVANHWCQKGHILFCVDGELSDRS